MLRPMPSPMVDTGMYWSSLRPTEVQGLPRTRHVGDDDVDDGVDRFASCSLAAMRIAEVATTGGAYCWMSINASAGTSSNCCLASSIASRHRATRSSGSARWVGRSTTRPDTRFVHVSSSSPVRMDTGTIARSGRSGSALCSVR